MQAPIARMVEDALNHSTRGIAHFLSTLELDKDTDNVPDLPGIINAADDNQAVGSPNQENIAIMAWPLLIITPTGPWPIKMTGVVGKGWDAPNLLMQIYYVTGDKMDLAQAWRDADYTLRTCADALNAALFASDMGAARLRKKILLVQMNNILWQPANVLLRQGRVSGFMTLDLWVRRLPP